MADRRKRSPVARFFRRNGLYIIIVCVLLLVVGAVLCGRQTGRAGASARSCRTARTAARFLRRFRPSNHWETGS